MPTLFHFGNSTASRGHGVQCLRPSLEIEISYVFPPPVLVPLVLSKFLAEHVNSPTQTFTSGGSMLDGGSLASHSSHHAGRCSSAVPSCKRYHRGCFGRPGAQGSVKSAFNLWLLSNVCYADRGFSSSVCQAVAGGNSKVCVKGLPAVLKEWAWWCA